MGNNMRYTEIDKLDTNLKDGEGMNREQVQKINAQVTVITQEKRKTRDRSEI
jgi:hypothetical protein